MAESLKSLMALIGQAWTDWPGMLHWITDEVLPASPEDAVLGVDARDLVALHLAICDGTAAASAPLVQTVLCLKRDYLETFLLTPQTACAEPPETHPLREALVHLASNARTSDITDGCFWLLKRFDAFSASPEFDEYTINNRESAIFSTSVFNPGGATFRAAFRNWTSPT